MIVASLFDFRRVDNPQDFLENFCKLPFLVMQLKTYIDSSDQGYF